MRTKRLAALGAALILGAAAACLPPSRPKERPASPGDRNVLWKIISYCLDPRVPDYCAVCPDPLVGTSCMVSNPLRRLEVWAKNSRFIAIRCSGGKCLCGGGFVHGLVLPLKPVSGAEDPRTLEPGMADAWRFAWAVALKKIEDPDSIVLAVNPPGRRTQDQLHIHIARLAPGAREALLSTSPGRLDSLFRKSERSGALAPETALRRIFDLARVWAAASQAAKERGFKDYGIAVISRPPGFLVAVVQAGRPEYPNPEEAFSIASCPASQ